MAASKCETCGRKLVKKTGKYGEFFGCPQFKQCEEKKSIEKFNMTLKKGIATLEQEIRQKTSELLVLKEILDDHN